MLYDQPDIGNYQPDIITWFMQKDPSETGVVLNHEGLIISEEGPIKKHVVPKK